MCARLLQSSPPPPWDLGGAFLRLLRGGRCPPHVVYRLSARKGRFRVVVRTEDLLGGLREVKTLVESSCREPFPYHIFVEIHS